MRIVIDIPEHLYEVVKEDGIPLYKEERKVLADAIANGTPIPKGHGRLIDADELKSHIHMENYKGFRIRTDGTVAFEYINDAPTIIEADKGEE